MLSLCRIPFYSWIRLTFFLYLILPQTQGAKVLYQSHVHPFLQDNERAIDDFISSAHERAKAAGITYLKQFIELIKQHVLGLPPKEPTPPSTPSTMSYTQSLLARFNLPSARPAYPSAAASTAGDFYSLLASAVTAATAQNPASSTRGQDLSNSGTLIPPTVKGEERLTFISAQRERLAILLSALDKEATSLQSSSAPRHVSSMFFDGSTSDEDSSERPKSSMSAVSGLSTRKSEADFEKIEAESSSEYAAERRQATRTASSGSWLPWSWAAKGDETPVDTVMSGTEKDQDHGKSSGVDA
jgi:receptor expression-enhancing protein 1/2/3/4